MDLPFLLYPPLQPTPSGSPLIVFLHGSGERGHDVAMVKRHGAPRYLEEGLSLSAHVLAPQCPEGASWTDVLEDLDRLLSRVLKSHDIGPRSVSLTGFSMGGFGAWGWATRSPSRFAAVAAVGGTGISGEFARTDVAALPHPCPFRIRIEHGDEDEIVPMNEAESWARRLDEHGHRYSFLRYAGLGHAAVCANVYGGSAHYDWLLGRTKR